jgi:malate synthase
MWDWEDVGRRYKAQLYEAWTNLQNTSSRMSGDGQNRSSTPTKTAQRNNEIETPMKESLPTIFHRVAGLHLRRID